MSGRRRRGEAERLLVEFERSGIDAAGVLPGKKHCASYRRLLSAQAYELSEVERRTAVAGRQRGPIAAAILLNLLIPALEG